MVLRDSKDDKMTFDAPVSGTNPGINPGANPLKVQIKDGKQKKKEEFTLVDLDPNGGGAILNSPEEEHDPSSASASSGSSMEALTPDAGIEHQIDPMLIRKKKTPSPSRNNYQEELRSLLFKRPSSEDNASSSSASEEVVDDRRPCCRSRSRSREVSPMQEKILLEQNWQNNLSKIDTILSDASAFHKGHFDAKLFKQVFSNKVKEPFFISHLTAQTFIFLLQEKYYIYV